MKPKIVVDTNILFSALLNPTGRIGTIIINASKYVQLYSCDFLNAELIKHRARLISISGYSENELDSLQFLLKKHIIFINEALLPVEILEQSEFAIGEVDRNDIPFVALTRYLEATLWTGDKKLITGLKQSQFIDAGTTADLSELFTNREEE